jgi:sortase A
MLRRVGLVGLVVALTLVGYGAYLQIRGDPTLKPALHAQAQLSLRLDAATQLMAASKRTARLAKQKQLRKRALKKRAIESYVRSLKIGQPVGRISIPRLGVKAVFIEGAPENQDARETLLLRQGPTHYRSDYGPLPLPGLGRTVAIAGHRTTYGAWFRHIDELRQGDLIVLLMPYGVYHYLVQFHAQVAYNAWSILNDHGYERLVLTSCDPPGQAVKRLAVYAKLIQP